jgi:cytochrome c peroxidase
VYELSPAGCSVDPALIDDRLTSIGDIIFNSKVLSGDRDTSCSTCHIDSEHLTDGLALSVGVGGTGEGEARLYSEGIVVARNAFTLFGRAHQSYKTLFWDGKIQESGGKIFSPIGEGYSLGFKSPLAVAAVMPILARDEFLGQQKLLFNSENLNAINEVYYHDQLVAANEVLHDLLLTAHDDDAGKLREALKAAGIDTLDLPLVGNALASFIAAKVSKDCTPSPWENYLAGSQNALSAEQKQGAVIFYGKGRCAACHSGSLFSDFDFHAIGVPQGEFGPYIHRQDIGRSDVTYRTEDRYKFRTPPLLRVSKTPPYGHNGTFETLKEAVLFHINPIPFFAEKGWTSDRELLTYGKILSTRSATLGYIEISEPEELSALLEFLEAL